MARIKTPRIIELAFKGEPLDGLNVRIKSIKFGKVREIMRLMDADDKDIEVMDRLSGELADAIVSWDLMDEDERPIEPTREAIDDLEFPEVMELVNEWLDAITGPGKELGKGSNSGGSFPGQPLTMEAL